MPVNPVLPNDKVKLYFITPAFERFTLSAICFEQRREEIDRLANLGIEAHCVVIADDENLGIAESFGFDTVEQTNEFLGRRWNDGWQWAIDKGATHVMPVGSDSWVNLDWSLGKFPLPGTVLASRNYALVHKNGERRCNIWIPSEFGVHFIVPVEHAIERGGRPCRDEIQKGCDTATLRAMGGFKYRYSEAHDLESIAFQSYPQITSYNIIRAKFGRNETFDPFGDDLKALYGDKLVGKVSDFYEGILDREIVHMSENATGPMSERSAWLLMREMRHLGKLIEGSNLA